MSIIPLTTELMIREHTRKMVLKEIKRRLLRNLLSEGRQGDDDTAEPDASDDSTDGEESSDLGRKSVEEIAEQLGVTLLDDDKLNGLIGILQHENESYIYSECIEHLNELMGEEGSALFEAKKYAQGMQENIEALDIEGTNLERAIIDFFGLALQDKTDDLFLLRLVLANFGEDYNTWSEFAVKFLGEEVAGTMATKIGRTALKGVFKKFRAMPEYSDQAEILDTLGSSTVKRAKSESPKEIPKFAELTPDEVVVLDKIAKTSGRIYPDGVNKTLYSILSLPGGS